MKDFEQEKQDIGEYVDSMLTDLSHHIQGSKLGLVIEYDRVVNDIYTISFINNNYYPLSIPDELKVYEAGVEILFNKYVK
jgi:hypothetical protein